MEEEILKGIEEELSTKYNKKENTIKIMLEKCNLLGYNIYESKQLVEEFFKLVE